jgi:hypothetical protein
MTTVSGIVDYPLPEIYCEVLLRFVEKQEEK